MKWIKCSERMPYEAGKDFFIKKQVMTFFVKQVANTMWKNNKHKEMLFVGHRDDSSHYVIENVVEWLDESSEDHSLDIDWGKIGAKIDDNFGGMDKHFYVEAMRFIRKEIEIQQNNTKSDHSLEEQAFNAGRLADEIEDKVTAQLSYGYVYVGKKFWIQCK